MVLGPPGQAPGVNCFTAAEPPWAKVAPPRRVKVKGRAVIAPREGPVLVGCAIAEVGGNPVETVAAAALATEYKADADKVRKKYPFPTYLTLQGEVADAEDNGTAGFQGLNSFTLRLKGDGDFQIRCTGADDERLVKALKPGQKLKVIGMFDGEAPEGGLIFTNCLVVEGPN